MTDFGSEIPYFARIARASENVDLSATVGPAESLRVRWREKDPGTWLYHCHVETHMAAGMIGTYQVATSR